MRAVVQRVTNASVHVDGELVAKIGAGLLTLLGVAEGDTDEDAVWLVRKISSLRIFEDEAGKMNLSLLDIGGSHLIVSQFTLLADVRKGNRPSFVGAARLDTARTLFEHAIAVSRSLGIPTESGRFQADMQVSLVNDGPVTITLESPSRNETG